MRTQFIKNVYINLVDFFLPVKGEIDQSDGLTQIDYSSYNVDLVNSMKNLRKNLLETSRDFCYIDNTVQMNLLAALTENDEATDQVYNCALNERTSLNQLYQMIEERLIQRVEHIRKKEPIYRDFRTGDVRHSQAEISKAQELLGYKVNQKIEEGLDESMDWYVSALIK